MTKEEYILTYGKKAYVTMVIQSRNRLRVQRGFKNSGEGRKILYGEEWGE